MVHDGAGACAGAGGAGVGSRGGEGWGGGWDYFVGNASISCCDFQESLNGRFFIFTPMCH